MFLKRKSIVFPDMPDTCETEIVRTLICQWRWISDSCGKLEGFDRIGGEIICYGPSPAVYGWSGMAGTSAEFSFPHLPKKPAKDLQDLHHLQITREIG